MDREIYVMALLELAEKFQGDPEGYELASRQLLQEMNSLDTPEVTVPPSPFRARGMGTPASP